MKNLKTEYGLNLTAKDTLGCILVGENKVKGQVISSTNAFNKLMNILKDEEDIELTIK